MNEKNYTILHSETITDHNSGREFTVSAVLWKDKTTQDFVDCEIMITYGRMRIDHQCNSFSEGIKYVKEFIGEQKKPAENRGRKVIARDGYLTLVEYAAKYNLSLSTLRMKVYSGLYPNATKIEGHWYIANTSPDNQQIVEQ